MIAVRIINCFFFFACFVFNVWGKIVGLVCVYDLRSGGGTLVWHKKEVVTATDQSTTSDGGVQRWMQDMV